MSDDQRAAVFGRRFARQLWRLIRVYWTSPDAKTLTPGDAGVSLRAA